MALRKRTMFSFAFVFYSSLAGVAAMSFAEGNIDSVRARAEFGRSLFFSGKWVVCYFLALYGSLMGSQSIVTERLRKTADLVSVAPQTTFSIVFQKLIAHVSIIAVLVSGLLPFFALVFLLGGISPNEFLQETIGLFLWGAWFVLVGLFASAVFTSLASAAGWAFFYSVLSLLMSIILAFVFPEVALYWGTSIVAVILFAVILERWRIPISPARFKKEQKAKSELKIFNRRDLTNEGWRAFMDLEPRFLTGIRKPSFIILVTPLLLCWLIIGVASLGMGVGEMWLWAGLHFICLLGVGSALILPLFPYIRDRSHGMMDLIGTVPFPCHLVFVGRWLCYLRILFPVLIFSWALHGAYLLIVLSQGIAFSESLRGDFILSGLSTIPRTFGLVILLSVASLTAGLFANRGLATVVLGYFFAGAPLILLVNVWIGIVRSPDNTLEIALFAFSCFLGPMLIWCYWVFLAIKLWVAFKRGDVFSGFTGSFPFVLGALVFSSALHTLLGFIALGPASGGASILLSWLHAESLWLLYTFFLTTAFLHYLVTRSESWWLRRYFGEMG
ncbi:MAG: hypothetical protein KC978_05760 [Candidatus Omnitrophica bacterium]|nr:hypothetical protein [Candidatus Omnitrophota bacterium]